MVKIAISSGHGRHIRGASGLMDEVNEARRVVEHVAAFLVFNDAEVETFHDDESDDQQENLERIVNWHNSQTRDLDVSVHFNAYEPTEEPMGVEVLWVTREDLATKISWAIATSGNLKDRGAKYRDDLYWLNNTDMPAVLIEVCFVDSEADVTSYDKNFQAICSAIAAELME